MSDIPLLPGDERRATGDWELVLDTHSDDGARTSVELSRTSESEHALTNISIGIDCLSATVTHVTRESVRRLGEFLLSWADSLDPEKN